jgi:hypothetical protein
MELLSTSVIGLIRQSTQLGALMAFIMVYWPINLLTSSIMLDQTSMQQDFLALLSVPAMPCLRGKPRRGAGWYAAASRRKRHREIQNAMSLARRRRRQEIRAENSPPGTVIEEDPSIQLPPDFSNQKMVTFPDDWDPLARAFRSRITPPGSTSSEQAMEGDPGSAHCTIEEEQEIEAEPVQNEESQGPDEAQPRSTSPPPLPPEQLHLIFDLRSLVEDLIFRAVCTSQRLDMLFTAHSCASPKQMCPTCAQPYTIPARAPAAQEDKERPG